jgi:hypothetical protein
MAHEREYYLNPHSGNGQSIDNSVIIANHGYSEVSYIYFGNRSIPMVTNP